MPKKEKNFSAGEVIFRQGEPCTSVYTILDGKVELFYEINGNVRVIDRKGEDDVLGANSVLEGTYDISARAATDVTVSEQSKSDYISQLQRSGELSPSQSGGANKDDDDDSDFSFDFDSGDDEDEEPAKPKRREAGGARNRRSTALTRRPNRSVNKINFDEEDDDDSGFSFSDSDEDEDDGKSKKKKALVKVEKPKEPIVPSVQKPVVLPAEIKRSPIKEWLKEAVNEPIAFGPTVLLASIEGDDGSLRDMLYQVLKAAPNMQVKAVDKPITDTNTGRATLQMRSWMTQHEADVGLYAYLDNAGRVLEFHTVRISVQSEMKVNPLTAGARFFLPIQMDENQKKLLRVFTICAIVPRRLEHEQLLRLYLPVVLNETADYASKPMVGLTEEEQAVNLTCFGNAVSLAGLFNKSAEDKQAQAAAVYLEALKLLPPYAQEYVFVNRQVGLIHQLEGERKDSIDSFKKAEETFQKATEAVSPELQPEVFGDLKLRIGNVRQKIAMHTGDGEDFSSAMTAYRDALKTLRPAIHTEKWADTINGLARTMQLFSSYSTKTTLLKKAVELYEKELSMLDRDTMPLLWARASNNLASALFLLSDREKSDPELLRRAVEVFSDALAVYDKVGAHKMAIVTGSNLKRVEKVLSETEKELEKHKSWVDDILDDNDGEKADAATPVAEAQKFDPDTTLTFERIAVFEELDDE